MRETTHFADFQYLERHTTLPEDLRKVCWGAMVAMGRGALAAAVRAVGTFSDAGASV